MATREPITKKLRFEVFKRDSFTCQYCGCKAPDVVLHIDHIHPVAKGGKSDICNLITSCQPCNSGKKDRLLSENQSIDKMRIQAEMLQERRDQLEMMMKWLDGLREIDSDAVIGLEKTWTDRTGYFFSNNGSLIIKKQIKKYGYALVSESIEVAIDQYIKYGEDGNATQDSAKITFDKIGAICYHKSLIKKDPVYGELFEMNRELSRRIHYHNWRFGLDLLKKATAHGATVESLRRLISSVKNWIEFREAIDLFCEKADEGNE